MHDTTPPIEEPRDAIGWTPTRRELLGRGALAGLGLAALGGWAAGQPQGAAQADPLAAQLYPGAVNAEGTFVLPPLPYAYEALEPHLDAETMRLHHDIHHAGYVRGLNDANAAIARARESGDFAALELHLAKASFHGGGHLLHCIFWASMTPGGGRPGGALARAIDEAFGSFDAWRRLFVAASVAVEGSGWGILAWSIPARRLIVTQARNHNLLSQWGEVPLLVVDVWEHAYYKKYSNRRGDYVEAFLNVVHWDDVARRYDLLRRALG